MASGIYPNIVTKFFGGDVDWVNDTVSAYLVDTALYTPSSAHTTLADIPEAAIISETLVGGRYIDGFELQADPLRFSAVTNATQTGGAVVLFIDADLTSDCYLIGVLMSDKISALPVTPTGADIVVEWPAEGFAVATVTEI